MTPDESDLGVAARLLAEAIGCAGSAWAVGSD